MARIWAERIWLAAAALATLGILGFYAQRLAMPLPIFAADEAAYLIRAIWPDPIVAYDPSVGAANNGVHLSVIRAVYPLGGSSIIADRLVNSAAYLGGLVLLWRSSTARLPRADQLALALIALAFPYYPFAFSNLAEGLYVGVFVLLLLATGRWYRSRPLFHALVAGAGAAALVLVKPNGLAVVVALAAVTVLDAAASGGWRRLPLRALAFAAAFFAVGNLIQLGAEAPAGHPLAFFLSQDYAGQLAQPPVPDALGLGALYLGSMVAALAVLAGVPVVAGLADLRDRWRAARGGFMADGRDLVFALLLLSAAMTLAMVTLFAVKIAWSPGERLRLWGRYFEFFAPMLWLAAAPALARPIGRRTAWACVAVMLAGLAGLLASLQAGIVLFPWDSTVLTAFFRADPLRAALGGGPPYRLLAAAATVAAAAALKLGLRPAQAGLALTLALAALSTRLDHLWLGPLVQHTYAFERDIRALSPGLPPEPAEIVLLAPEANDGHLGFLRLNARPHVYLGRPSLTAPDALATATAVVVAGPEAPPGGPWVRTFQGPALSLFRRQPAARGVALRPLPVAAALR
jgi:hypothetical protein